MERSAVKNRLCISTVIDQNYANYIPLFIYTLKTSYPEYHIKLFTYGKFNQQVKNALDLIKFDYKIVPGLFNKYAKYKYSPISWRFIIPPEHYKEYDYVYITDIDMMILPEKISLLNFHLNEMSETGLCYSNSKRNAKHWEGHRSLTGLHFVSQEWFEKTEKARKKYDELLKMGGIGEKREFDGHMLYLMAKESGLKTPEKMPLTGRHHGVHLGNWRLFHSYKKLNKRVGVSKCSQWKKIRNTEEFEKIYRFVSGNPMLRNQIEQLDAHCKRRLG